MKLGWLEAASSMTDPPAVTHMQTVVCWQMHEDHGRPVTKIEIYSRALQDARVQTQVQLGMRVGMHLRKQASKHVSK